MGLAVGVTVVLPMTSTGTEAEGKLMLVFFVAAGTET